MARKCFVACPIGEAGSDIRKRSDTLLQYIIRPVCEQGGFEVARADEMNNHDSITGAVIEALETADLVIADLTGNNPNVFYEIGYRKALRLPAIHLCEEGSTIPFDVHDVRAISYRLDLSGADEAKERLARMIKDIPLDSAANPAHPAAQLQAADVMQMLYSIEDSVRQIAARVNYNEIYAEILKKQNTSKVYEVLQKGHPSAAAKTQEALKLMHASMDEDPSINNASALTPEENASAVTLKAAPQVAPPAE